MRVAVLIAACIMTFFVFTWSPCWSRPTTSASTCCGALDQDNRPGLNDNMGRTIVRIMPTFLRNVIGAVGTVAGGSAATVIANPPRSRGRLPPHPETAEHAVSARAADLARRDRPVQFGVTPGAACRVDRRRGFQFASKSRARQGLSFLFFAWPGRDRVPLPVDCDPRDTQPFRKPD